MDTEPNIRTGVRPVGRGLLRRLIRITAYVAIAWAALGIVYSVFLLIMANQVRRNASTSWKDYNETVHSATDVLPIAVQMETLFPGQTDHFITHYGIEDGLPTKTWNSEAYFGGRYCLTMQIEVFVDSNRNTIRPSGEPTFYLEEITSFRGGVASNDGLHATFGEEKWQEIVRHDGDFMAAGFNLKKNSPAVGFDEYARAMRLPRIPVSLLNEQAVPRGVNKASPKTDAR